MVSLSEVVDGLVSFFLILVDRCYIVLVLMSDGFFGILSMW